MGSIDSRGILRETIPRQSDESTHIVRWAARFDPRCCSEWVAKRQGIVSDYAPRTDSFGVLHRRDCLVSAM